MESDVVKTGVRVQRREELRSSSGGCRSGNRCGGGMTVLQALIWNMRTCRCDVKGVRQVAKTARR